MSDDLPGKGEKPNRPRSLDDLTGETNSGQADSDDGRDKSPVQLNVRVPTYLRKALQHRKIDTGKTIEQQVTEALASYLDV
jgi:hypothetical protein